MPRFHWEDGEKKHSGQLLVCYEDYLKIFCEALKKPSCGNCTCAGVTVRVTGLFTVIIINIILFYFKPLN